MTAVTVTPSQRLVLQALAYSSKPQTIDSLAERLEKTPHSIEHLMRKVRSAIRGTGVEIVVHRQGRGKSWLYEVKGQRATINALLGEITTTVPAVALRLSVITLPPIGGLSYAYTPEGRLTVGGELQPVRIG